MYDETSARKSSQTDYEVFREKWVHEDHLINHRLNWLIMIQTILFAAYGLLLAVKVEEPDSKYISEISRVIKVFPAIGISVSTLIFLGIVGAVGAMYQLRKKRIDEVKKMDIDVALWTSVLGQVTCLLMPLVFVVGWLYCYFS